MHHAVALSSVSSCEVEVAAWLHKECERALQCVQPCMAVSKIKKKMQYLWGKREIKERPLHTGKRTHTHKEHAPSFNPCADV